MPTYEYRCPEGHDFEQFVLNMSKAAAELPCPVCGKLAARRISAGAGLVFKGSGFYITDYGKDGKKDQRSSAEAKGGGADKSGGEAAKDGGEVGKSGGEAKSGGAAEKSGGEAGASSGDSKSGAAEKGSAKGEPSAKSAPAAPPKKSGGAE
jgi:putative FmdB family regulatory protein